MLDFILRWFGYPRPPHVQGPPPKSDSGDRPRHHPCKNCGRPLRGLAHAPGIPVHVDTESRFCDSFAGVISASIPSQPTRFAQWPGEDELSAEQYTGPLNQVWRVVYRDGIESERVPCRMKDLLVGEPFVIEGQSQIFVLTTPAELQTNGRWMGQAVTLEDFNAGSVIPGEPLCESDAIALKEAKAKHPAFEGTWIKTKAGFAPFEQGKGVAP